MIHCPSCYNAMATIRPVEIVMAVEPRSILVTAAVVCTSCAAISEIIPQANYRAVEYPGLTVGHLVAMAAPLHAMNLTYRTLRPSTRLVCGES